MKQFNSLWAKSPFVIFFALLLLIGIGIEPVSADVWQIETVDSAGGYYTSLALDPTTGYPRISYVDGTNKDLKYATYNGSTWQTKTVDSLGDIGSYISLALDPTTGYPRISYYDSTNHDLKYASLLVISDPSITSITIPVDPVPVNAVVSVNATFTDPDAANTHTAVWNWGDSTTSAGTVTEASGSGTVSGLHTYTTPGDYTITLTVINSLGASNTAVAETSTVVLPNNPPITDNPMLPVANFTSNVTQGFAPLTVQFTDLSENATYVNWNFGDGQTSMVRNPSHTYNSPGTYTVSLNVSNTEGYNISTKPDLIIVNSNTPSNGLVTDGLVVYYDGNLSGNSLADLSGNSNTGYATNVTQGANQSTGANYINLNGVNSKIDVSNNAQTNVSSPVSIEFIGSINEFKPYGALVGKYNNGLTGWYLSISSADPYNKVRVALGVQGGGLKVYNSDASLVAGQVYDIVLTYDNNTSNTYINGVNSGSRRLNSPIAGVTNNITIGYSPGLPSGNCSMYAFRLYNRALSPDEVLQNYNNDHWRYVP